MSTNLPVFIFFRVLDYFELHGPVKYGEKNGKKWGQIKCLQYDRVVIET